MEILVIFGIIMFVAIVVNRTQEEENGIFHLKHIYGIPSCDYFVDIDTRVNNDSLILNKTRNIYLKNIKYFNFYSKTINTSQPNFKNAFIGGVVAGGVGAIIGSNTKKQVSEIYYFMEIVYIKNNQQAVVVLSDNPKKFNNNLKALALLLQNKAKANNIEITITASSYEKSETYKILNNI